MSYYLIHSAKGTTWSNHKYVKKENGKYYYKDEKGNLVEGDAPEEETTSTETEETNSKSKKSASSIRKEAISKMASQVMSGTLSQEQLRKSNGGKDYIDVMNAVNSKFKKPNTSSKSSSKKESSSTKSTDKTKSEETSSNKEETKATTTSTEEVKTETTQKTEVAKTNTDNKAEASSTDNSANESIKDAIKSVVSVSDNDSIYATKNEDGTTTVTVDFADGKTQDFILTQSFDVINKTEKKKKEFTHTGVYKNMSDRFRLTGNYLVHSAKGTSWEKKEHKYIRKENNRYIYEDNKKLDDKMRELETNLDDKENNDISLKEYNSKHPESKAINSRKESILSLKKAINDYNTATTKAGKEDAELFIKMELENLYEKDNILNKYK